MLGTDGEFFFTLESVTATGHIESEDIEGGDTVDIQAGKHISVGGHIEISLHLVV